MSLSWRSFGGALLLVAACGGHDGGPPPSEAGDLVVSYSGGGSEVGAILLTITGGAVQSVTAVSGQPVQVSYAAPVPGTTRVIMTGSFHAGDLLKIRVADVTFFASYSVHTDQAADNLTFSLLDPTNYTFIVHR